MSKHPHIINTAHLQKLHIPYRTTRKLKNHVPIYVHEHYTTIGSHSRYIRPYGKFQVPIESNSPVCNTKPNHKHNIPTYSIHLFPTPEQYQTRAGTSRLNKIFAGTGSMILKEPCYCFFSLHFSMSPHYFSTNTPQTSWRVN